MIKQKTGSAIVVAVVIVAAIAVIGAGIFLYPYEPEKPPVVDDNLATPEGMQKVVDANNEFAFDLYSRLGEGNVFYSPYSISSALAMTYEGAKGQTADEIKSVFHFPDTNLLRQNFAGIYNSINSRSGHYELRTGNALWLQKDYPFLEEFVGNVENYYGGKAAGLDFVDETEKSRQTINSFIEEQTNNKIQDLIPEGTLGPMTRMVLTNAIYFKGKWEWEFDKSNTKDMDFKITSDNVVKTPMMFMEPDEARFGYADLDDLQILEMPYKGEDLSIVVVLPKESLDDLGDVTIEDLDSWKSEMKPTLLDEIYFPKFEFDTKYFMADVLSDLGMPTAFASDGSADFSGMTLEEDLYINSVIHQAYVKVDEEGTEAAAATAVAMGATSAMPIEKKIFRADHPFLFFIQQRETGNILFMGRVVDPAV